MDTIPFEPSDNNVKLTVPIGDQRYVFYHRWNSRDQAWYVDLYEEDFTPILLGIKLTLGGRIGRSCSHPFFVDHALVLMDTSRQGLDPGFDDLGERVILIHTSLAQAQSLVTDGVDA